MQTMSMRCIIDGANLWKFGQEFLTGNVYDECTVPIMSEKLQQTDMYTLLLHKKDRFVRTKRLARPMDKG